MNWEAFPIQFSVTSLLHLAANLDFVVRLTTATIIQSEDDLICNWGLWEFRGVFLFEALPPIVFLASLPVQPTFLGRQYLLVFQ